MTKIYPRSYPELCCVRQLYFRTSFKTNKTPNIHPHLSTNVVAKPSVKFTPHREVKSFFWAPKTENIFSLAVELLCSLGSAFRGATDQHRSTTHFTLACPRPTRGQVLADLFLTDHSRREVSLLP